MAISRNLRAIGVRLDKRNVDYRTQQALAIGGKTKLRAVSPELAELDSSATKAEIIDKVNEVIGVLTGHGIAEVPGVEEPEVEVSEEDEEVFPPGIPAATPAPPPPFGSPQANRPEDFHDEKGKEEAAAHAEEVAASEESEETEPQPGIPAAVTGEPSTPATQSNVPENFHVPEEKIKTSETEKEPAVKEPKSEKAVKAKESGAK